MEKSMGHAIALSGVAAHAVFCANLCRGMALEKVEGDSDSPANNGYFLTALIGYSGGGAMKLARR